MRCPILSIPNVFSKFSSIGMLLFIYITKSSVSSYPASLSFHHSSSSFIDCSQMYRVELLSTACSFALLAREALRESIEGRSPPRIFALRSSSCYKWASSSELTRRSFGAGLSSLGLDRLTGLTSARWISGVDE